MKGAHGVLITTHMRLWQKRSRLCHFLELRSGMRIDSLGCTWWVLSSKWSKSSQLAVATEPLVPLIRLGLYVLGRCSTWGCLFSRRRIFSVALPPQDAALQHARRSSVERRRCGESEGAERRDADTLAARSASGKEAVEKARKASPVWEPCCIKNALNLQVAPRGAWHQNSPIREKRRIPRIPHQASPAACCGCSQQR